MKKTILSVIALLITLSLANISNASTYKRQDLMNKKNTLKSTLIQVNQAAKGAGLKGNGQTYGELANAKNDLDNYNGNHISDLAVATGHGDGTGSGIKAVQDMDAGLISRAETYDELTKAESGVEAAQVISENRNTPIQAAGNAPEGGN